MYILYFSTIVLKFLTLLKILTDTHTSLQLCPTFLQPRGLQLGRLLCLSHGILQARTLEWIAICFSRDVRTCSVFKVCMFTTLAFLQKGSLFNILKHAYFFFLVYLFIFFIFKLYITVLVLPNIKMNPPQVYMCSPP